MNRMYNFTMSIPTEIIFGEGAEEQAGMQMKRYADRILLLYGSERIFRTGLGQRLTACLEEAGCTVVPQGGVTANADSELIRKAVRVIRDRELNGILAVGGGSVIDSAKAAAAGACLRGTVEELFRGDIEPEAFLPVGAVVTLPATGSEANGMAVIQDHETHDKLLRYFPQFKPRFALLDPALTVTLPARQTAAGGFDVFAHAFERFFDLRRESVLLDRMTAGLMKTVTECLPRVIHDPGDLQNRAEMMFAATAAHSDMLGPGGDFACHTMSHILTKEYGLAHGAALAMLIPAWCREMFPKNGERFAEFYRQVFGEKEPRKGQERLETFVDEIGIPRKLGSAGIGPEKLAEETMDSVPQVGEGFCDGMNEEEIIRVFRRIMP